MKIFQRIQRGGIEKTRDLGYNAYVAQLIFFFAILTDNALSNALTLYGIPSTASHSMASFRETQEHSGGVKWRQIDNNKVVTAT